MLTTSLRIATAADADAIGTVGYASWCHGIGAFLPPEVCRRVTPGTFESFAVSAFPEILVAEAAGRIVGLTATEDGDHTISDLWVSPDYEGRGVGSALLAGVEARIAARGHAVAELEVLTMNRRALALYRYRGYRPLWSEARYDPTLRIDIHKTRLRKALAAGLP